jgi:hypothetical protein
MSTKAERAALRVREQLADRIRTHYMPSPPERRYGEMTYAQAVARGRNGRRSGPSARRRKPSRR